MKKNHILFLFFLLMGISLFAAPMNGNYTIGGTSPDFNTINDAVNALIANGIDGNTTFLLRNGTYNEQFTIPSISGSSSSNWITFRSESGSASDVTISYTSTSSSDDYIVKLDGANYIDFHQLTFRAQSSSNYGTVFVLNDGTSHIQIRYNTIYGNGINKAYSKLISSTLTGSSSISYLEIQSNYLYDANSAVYLYAYSSNAFSNVQIEYNYFQDVMNAIYTREAPSIQIEHNQMSNINVGVYIENCSNSNIEKNMIFTQKTGIEAKYSSNLDIMNNAIKSEATPYSGNYGMGQGILLNGCSYSDLYYNSVEISENSSYSTSAAFLSYSSVDLNIKNNIFSNLGAGYGIYIRDVGFDHLEMDYNNIFTGKAIFAYFSNNNYYTLSSFKALSTYDNQNTVSAYPGFDTNLHPTTPWVDGKGTPISAITDDIDGNTRDASNPDIGCYEFTSDSAYSTMMNGTYSVGTGKDYENLAEAITDLIYRGVNGSVSLQLYNGNYDNTNYKLYCIPSTTGSNQVSISLANGTPNLTYSASGESDNYLFQVMSRSTFYDFSYITMEVTGSNYTRIFDIESFSKLRLLGCDLTAPQTTSSNSQKNIIYSYNNYLENTSFLYNTFHGGDTALYLYGPSNENLQDIEIYRCNFNECYTGIYIANAISPHIHENTFNNTSSSYASIFAANLSEHFVIEKNKTFKTNTNYGFYINSSIGGDSTSTRGLIANNVIKTSDYNLTCYAMNISYIKNTDIVFNSIYHEGTSGRGTPFYMYSDNGNNTIKNNIFATQCTDNSYALEIIHPSSNTDMDYNDYYTPNNYLLKIENSYHTLKELQDATGEHLHSVSIFPYFTSDMHTTSPSLNDRGVWLDIVTTDFDNQNRTNPPDMGADEYSVSSSLQPLNGIYTIGTSKSDYSSFSEASEDLSYRGISGDVTFLVESGTYYEKPIFKEYYSDDPTYIVIFKAQSGNSEDVILQYDSSASNENYTVLITGADHLRFEDITFTTTHTSNYYNTLLRITGSSDNLQILNCSFIYPDTVNVSDSNNLIYFDNATYNSASIVNNNMYSGYYGIYDNGDNDGLIISYNYFSHTKYPVNLSNHTAPYISHNILLGFINAINLTYCSGSTQIYDNKMISWGFQDYYHGYNLVNLYNCDAISSAPTSIYNNILYAHDNNVSTLTGYSFTNCSHLDFYHNNIVIENDYDIYIDSPRGSAVYCDGDSIDIKNNILAYFGNGLAFQLNTNTNSHFFVDYNAMYNQALFIAKTASDETYKTIKEIQDSTDYCDHSYRLNPLLDSNLQTTCAFLVGKGLYNSRYTHDYNNVARNNPPTIGATEYTPSSTDILSGTYTIGNSKSDYSSIQDAINALSSQGIGANDVIFTLENGTYNEQFEISSIPRELNTNANIIFKSQSENANDVTITCDASASVNYIAKLICLKNFRFEYLKFQPLDSSYGIIFKLKGYHQNIKFDHCVFEGSTTSSPSNGRIILFDSASFDNIYITENTFNNGSYAVYYRNSYSPEYAVHMEIDNNTFTDNYLALYLNSITNLFINNNQLSNQKQTAIQLENIYDSLRVYKNTVTVNRYASLYLKNYNGASSAKGFIANNYFGNNSSDYAYYDVYLENVNYLDFYNNTAVVNNEASIKTFYLSGYNNSNLNIRNNIFSQKAGGITLYVLNSNGILNMEYNLLYTSGSTLAYWQGTNCADLSELITASGYNNSSISADPLLLFTDKPDLPSNSPAIDGGITLSEITEDIYGTARTVPYDMGAYEYVGSITPSVPQNIRIEIINGNTARISWDASSQALQYKVEYSDSPDSGFTQAAFTTNTSVDIPISTMKKFYRVIAIH